MAHVIGEGCLMCGACASVCPVEAIAAGDDKFVIDDSKCIDCGACAGVCPVSIIEG